MSLFDFPRINITGTVQLSPGTANNDDDASGAFLNGQPLALINSATVTPNTFGMSDADFITWVQQLQTFTTTPGGTTTTQQIPAEWNYFGDMSSTVGSGAASVVGVVTGPAPSQRLIAPDPSVPVSSLLGASLTYSGCITDLNSQNSPPATQFFIPQLTLTSGSTIVLQGPASKGACQWINFFRNVNAQADQGAGGYIYHVILKSQSSAFDIPGFEDPSIIGAIFRYYLYNPLALAATNADILALYANQQQNPVTLQFVATIAPLFANEAIITGPVGRLLVAQQATLTTPTTNNNGGGTIALAPAVVQQDENTISVEFVGTFPDNFQPTNPLATSQQPYTNDKWNFGAVNLVVSGNGTSATIGSVDYTDTARGNAAGWLFDYDISTNAGAQQALADPNASFALESTEFGSVLAEIEYFIVTNQVSIYAEQGGVNDSFFNQGTTEPATVSVYSRGVELSAADCPPLSVWSYATVPWQDPPGSRVLLTNSFQPGDPLVANTSQSGNFNFVFTVGTQPPPPQSWLQGFTVTLLMTNTTTISLRILPNGVDFSSYYGINEKGEPLGNASLTFDVVYQNVLRTYYLLFPAMNGYIPLNDEQKVNAAAGKILKRIDPSIWMSPDYMPRTRDMSQSRRMLLQAYCNAVKPPG